MTVIPRSLSTARLVGLAGLFTLLFSVADANTKNGFRVDEALIPANEIRKGGPPRDGIPSLDHPVLIAAVDASYLVETDRVLGVSINGVAHAYPIRILNYHEIVNDVIGDSAIAITFCPLCGSGTAFVANVDGQKLEFGVSGLLYNSDVLLYDRESGSLWSQLMRQAIAGPMKGVFLQQLPASHTSWREWVSRHPDTKVLSDNTGYQRNYEVDPYPNYGHDGRLYFPVAHSSAEYARKDLVMGLEIDGRFKAYPFTELRKGPGRFRDEFADVQIDVTYDDEHQTARIFDSDGVQIATTTAFWFAWYAFHPDTEIYKAE